MRPALLAILILATLTSCMGAPVSTTSDLPQSGATSADYQVVVDASEAVLDDARELVPATAITKDEKTVTDLESDRHRMRCTDTTSQYTNIENLYLAAGTDEIALIDEIRDAFLADGWSRVTSATEQEGLEQDPEGAYVQTLTRDDGYGLSLRRGSDTDGTAILQFGVFSACIGNPEDKPETWGLG